MRTLLIDADIAVYQFSSTVEEPVAWPNGVWTLHADASRATAHLDDFVTSTMDALEADQAVLALSDPKANFRKRLLPTYKQHRGDNRKPVCWQAVRDHVEANYRTYQRDGLEGDDILGILATSPKVIPGEKIIVSIDKDMRTIPGRLWSSKRSNQRIADHEISHPSEAIEIVTEAQAREYHLMQTLTGDQTDGYAGLPGTGPVKAARILAPAAPDYEYAVAWPLVVAAFAKAGLGEEEALTQARMARILQRSDYDFKNKEPILWRPTNQ